MSFFKKLKSTFSSLIINREDKTNRENLKEALIEADFGIKFAENFMKDLKSSNLYSAFKNKIISILTPLIKDIEIDKSKRPFVIILEGVNGSGKTTTVAKLAYLLKQKGFSVDIAACDTFRIAAVDQLAIWARKLGCNIFKSDSPKDPASIAFEAMKMTKSDVLIIDTAGRLHNNINLMNELEKIHRVIKKHDESAPHMTLLTIDATIGQNTIEQVREFSKVNNISGLIINKLDGGAKCGIIVRIADEFKIPILGVGIGESEKDFAKFSVDKFLKDFEE